MKRVIKCYCGYDVTQYDKSEKSDTKLYNGSIKCEMCCDLFFYEKDIYDFTMKDILKGTINFDGNKVSCSHCGSTLNIIDDLGVLSESKNGWAKMVRIVSWNNRTAQLDIRSWGELDEKCGKGLSLNEVEAKKLYEILKERYEKKNVKVD